MNVAFELPASQRQQVRSVTPPWRTVLDPQRPRARRQSRGAERV